MAEAGWRQYTRVDVVRAAARKAAARRAIGGDPMLPWWCIHVLWPRTPGGATFAVNMLNEAHRWSTNGVNPRRIRRALWLKHVWGYTIRGEAWRFNLRAGGSA